jgi:hypothetical protein
MRRFVCVIGAFALAAGAAGAATVPCGIRGTVYAMPGGACLQGTDCTKRPLADAMIVFSSGNRSVRTTTNGEGAFRVHMAPGTYAVRLGSVTSRRLISPARASVVRGKMRAMTFVVAGPKIP